jgi:hypothetical protein
VSSSVSVSSLFLFVDLTPLTLEFQAAKDVRASHGAIIDLFKRIESFFKRLEEYTQISLTTKMAEVLVKIVIELLSILSIATKEVKQPLASELSEREIPHSSPLMFLQGSLPGHYWGRRILRMR